MDISSYRDNINFSSNIASVEDLSSIFDDNINTFWEGRQELTLVINLESEIELIKIEQVFLTIGKDGSDSINRNPSEIIIFASNDKNSWIPISEIKIESNIKNGEKKEYKISSENYYKYFRIYFPAILRSDIMRIYELDLNGCIK